MPVNNYEVGSAVGDSYEGNEELVEKVSSILGHDAVELVLNLAETMSPQLRADTYSSLEALMGTVDQHIKETGAHINCGNVVDIVTREPIEAIMDAQPVTAEVGLLDTPESTVENKIPLANLMHRQLRNIFDEIPATLTVDDAAVVVETIQELRGRVLVRKKNVDSGARLHALVCGMSLNQVGGREDPPVGDSPISNWVKLYCAKLKEQELYSPEYASELLMKKLGELQVNDQQPDGLY